MIEFQRNRLATAMPPATLRSSTYDAIPPALISSSSHRSDMHLFSLLSGSGFSHHTHRRRRIRLGGRDVAHRAHDAIGDCQQRRADRALLRANQAS
jgi:hypothetical protein